MGVFNDDLSLKLAKAIKNGFFPDVDDSEVDILTKEANTLFGSDVFFFGKGGTVLWDKAEQFLNIYPSGSGSALHIASQTGFSGPYLQGIGVDHDGVTGLELSIKANGNGISFAQWGPAGVGLLASNRSNNPFIAADIYAGLGSGMQFALKSGAFFNDGNITAGNTQLTSVTAAFVAGDVGKTIASAWPYPNDLQAGTTISAVVNGTTVTLSKTALATRTNSTFSVAGRVNADNQRLLSFYDTDGSSPIFQVRKTYSILSVPIFARDVGTSALRVHGLNGQTADLQSWRDYNTNILTRVNADGFFMTRKTSAPADAAIQPAELSFWFDSTNGAAKLMVKAKQADGTVRTGSMALI